MAQRDPDCKCGGPHAPFWTRPGLSRRQFFRLTGTALSGYYFANVLEPPQVVSAASVPTQGTAKNCIFVLLAGAPSHVDTFDLKEGSWTPATFNPTSYGDIRFPQGLLPNLANQLNNIAIVRSMRSWALVHNLSQTWTQIGRNPTSALGKVAPNIGAVVALELDAQRKPSDILPGFVSLNPGGTQIGSGYFPSVYAPFGVNPAASGLPDTTNPDGQARLNLRWQLLHSLDDSLRVNSPLGRAPEDMNNYYTGAWNLTYNPVVNEIFAFSAADHARYGSNSFGDACLVAKNLLEKNIGTRFVQITLGGWDHHSNIYQPAQLPARAKQLDDGLGTLLADMGTSGLLDNTLVVVCGEFGRTVDTPNNQNGRDHYFQQFALFAGAGVKGGRAIGSTDSRGAYTADPGWSRQRDVKPEDVEATIYSAMGIDWTIVRYDDPFKRGFEYVPLSKYDVYGPINELWS